MGQLKRYTIHVNYGDNNTTAEFQFVHKDYAKYSLEEQDNKFHLAVTELNHIYSDYGRFATVNGIKSLFDKYGFEQSFR